MSESFIPQCDPISITPSYWPYRGRSSPHPFWLRPRWDYVEILSWKAYIQYMDSWNSHNVSIGDPDLANGGTGDDGGYGGSHISEEAPKVGKA